MKRLICVLILLLHSVVFLHCYAETGERVDVSSFGAVPNDGLDDSEAIRKACDYCRHRKGAVLEFNL